MADDMLGTRGRPLEQEFFTRQNEALKQQLREKQAKQARRESLTEAAGIADERLLDALVEMNISTDTLAAISLVPLIEVAWAEGEIHPKERAAVLAGAREAAGISEDSPAHQLIDTWLTQRPSARLFEVWADYVRVFCEKMDADAKRRLQDDVLGRARRVAEAARGAMGFGRKVSRAEEAMLAKLEKAFG